MKLKIFTVTICLTILTACGGGGGGSASVNAVPTTPAVVVTPEAQTSTIVPTVSSAAYASGSEEMVAFNLLNNERSTCGFGALAQNTKLDTAALNHASYLVLNHQQGHYETSGLPGFTGVYPADRVLAVGYTASLLNAYGQPSESQTIIPSTTVLAGSGVVGMRGLMSAPYHLTGMFRGYKEAGFSFLLASTLVPGAQYVLPVINFGISNPDAAQLPGSSDVLTYPCQGTTGIDYRLASNENPAPVVGRNLAALPVGHPILVSIRNGNVLDITSATLIKVSTSAAVTLRPPYTKITDTTNTIFYYRNEGFILPDVPLEPSTQYQATINGTNNGSNFSRTFTFTTGTGG